MGEDIASNARGELASIDLATFGPPGNLLRSNVSSVDPRRHTLTFADGRVVGLIAHLNRRKKKLRDWIKKWGPPLKRSKFRIRLIGEGLDVGIIVEEIPKQPDDDDAAGQFEAAAQIESEKLKEFFPYKRRRRKRLGKQR